MQTTDWEIRWKRRNNEKKLGKCVFGNFRKTRKQIGNKEI